MSFRKKEYVLDLAKTIKKLSEVADIVSERHKEYFDNGYNTGGADPITDLDLSSNNIDLTAANVGTVITMIDELNKFFTNQAVTTGDHLASINVIRRIREQ